MLYEQVGLFLRWSHFCLLEVLHKLTLKLKIMCMSYIHSFTIHIVANSTREETTVVTYHKKSVDELADTLMFGEQANVCIYIRTWQCNMYCV